MTKSKKKPTRARAPKSVPAAAADELPAVPGLKDGRVYLLRTCAKDGGSYEGFRWDLAIGAVNRPEKWNPRPVCGNGLHGLPGAEGKASHLSEGDEFVAVVISTPREQFVAIDSEKAKCAEARVELVVPGVAEAIAWMVAAGVADGTRCVRGQATASGYSGQATASGYSGQATASGYRGQATASGDRGQATASGDRGQATASGDSGQATAAKNGIAQARYRVRSGALGIVLGVWWDGERDRVIVGYVGEGEIKPDTWYEVQAGTLIEIPEAEA